MKNISAGLQFIFNISIWFKRIIVVSFIFRRYSWVKFFLTLRKRYHGMPLINDMFWSFLAHLLSICGWVNREGQGCDIFGLDMDGSTHQFRIYSVKYAYWLQIVVTGMIINRTHFFIDCIINYPKWEINKENNSCMGFRRMIFRTFGFFGVCNIATTTLRCLLFARPL